MGMYTAFRAKVTVKPEFRSLIKTLHSAPYSWDAVQQKHHGVISTFWYLTYRRNFIPFGSGGFIPSGWGKFHKAETENDWDEENASYSEFDAKSGVWEFCCTLKNYEGEINTFRRLVFGKIVQETEYCEAHYEEDADAINLVTSCE